jgi:hypothetical protein
MKLKEKPMLFLVPAVQAILSDRKTQARQLIKRQPDPEIEGNLSEWELYFNCPYGKTGDRLWVKEPWLKYCDLYFYRASDASSIPDSLLQMGKPKWEPSIFMPRSASRITLEIVNVRVERLQDISEEDAIAEGIQKFDDGLDSYALAQGKEVTEYFYGTQRLARSCMGKTAKEAFRRLWDSINADCAPWDSNPWVWCVEFKRVTAAA